MSLTAIQHVIEPCMRLQFQDIDRLTSLPVMLRIFAEELDQDGFSTDERTEVDVAIVVDDVVNHKPRFLQKQ